MSTPILTTKLYIPPPRPEIVLRPRLIERLNQGLAVGRKLTLISAPAGFGKTTLVSSWLHQLAGEQGSRGAEEKEFSPAPLPLCTSAQAAWLSLDEGDNNLTRFLAYLVAALQTIAPNMGTGVLAALHATQSQPSPPESLLAVLLNEIATLPAPFLLVLDDYHEIEAPAINQVVIFLLEHLPPQLRLVIATREEPPLPLARYRVRGQLTELRAADLRFTPTEAAEFLKRVMGLNLSVEDIAALEARTEGWIAGLQLAALSMQGHQDITGFIKSFTGSHRFVLDYLVEEVLQRQPDPVRSFLLQTSILDRLNGPLCDAVLSRGAEGQGSRGDENLSSAPLLLCPPAGSQKTLEYLERANLFVVPLDDERRWYRYHHLFADVLQAHLLAEQPQQVSGLHRRASVWYEQNGLPPDAIRHALAAKDFERAANLIELAWSAMDITMQSATWLGWAKALPDELIRSRPVLSVGYAWALLDGGEMETGEARLRDSERWLAMPADMSEQPRVLPAEMVVVDEEQFRSLPASIATARAYRALALGDIPDTVKYARQALQLTPEQDQIRHTQATALLGLAQYASGDLAAADRALADFLAKMWQADDILSAIGITFTLANLKLARGRLHEAVRVYQQALQFTAGRGEPMPLGTAELYRGLSELYCERNDLASAADHLLSSQKLGEQAVLTGWPHRLSVAEARLKEAQGDLEGALARLEEAERRYIRSPLPDVRPIAALKTRVWVRQGRLAEALAWAREQGLSVADDLSYLREFEHLTLVRVFIAAYKRDRGDDFLHLAMELLARLLPAAETGGRVGSVIEILLLQALAHEAQGDIPLALVSLERALTLAEPEDYVRIFVGEGQPVAELLGGMKAEGGTLRVKEYIHKLLAAFGKPQDLHPASRSFTQSVHPLVEPLSERELEVLRLLGTELTGPEIARQLLVSLSTVRTHTQNIYTKLGVNNRRAAIRRAEELDLL